MNLYEHLLKMREELPPWLAMFEDGIHFSPEEFFGARVVFYPGSGTDGHPVKLFGSTHSAHCFVYADYNVSQAELEAELGHPRHGFRGYHTLARVLLRESDLVPRGWISHAPSEFPLDRYRVGTVAAAPFGFLEVLERHPDLNGNHGARRLAVLFLGADGIATYDALFCQEHSNSAPLVVVLQDHGFGGNYDQFGRDGLLASIATRCNVVPHWLLVGENTAPWRGYKRFHDVDGDRGGMHNTLRFLYKRPQESPE